MRLATWNVEWAGPSSSRSTGILAQLHEVAADVWVVTEGKLGLLPSHGHLIDAGSDWGYGEQHERRKVLAWSRHRWREIRLIDEGAARGRLVVATTDLKDGPIRVIAVCIPWRDAHVRSGRRDAHLWEEHLQFCNQLSQLRQMLDARPNRHSWRLQSANPTGAPAHARDGGTGRGTGRDGGLDRR